VSSSTSLLAVLHKIKNTAKRNDYTVSVCTVLHCGHISAAVL